MTIRVVPAVIITFCVLALTAVPFIHRAYQKRKADAAALWERNADQFVGIVYNQLKSYCQSQTNFPALTVEELHRCGIFDAPTVAFLKFPKVHFHPFASTDPDTNVVLSVVIVPEMKMGRWRIPPHPVVITKGNLYNTNITHGIMNLNTYR